MPSLLVCEHAILLNLGSLRAIAMQERVLIFNYSRKGGKAFIDTLLPRLNPKNVNGGPSMPFVIEVVEAALNSRTQRLEQRLMDLEPRVLNVLKRISDEDCKLLGLNPKLLSSNQLSGKLPASFAGLINLMDFRINDNNFGGAIPDFIQNWKQLTRLEMHGSGLEGPIPSNISFLNKLIEFTKWTAEFLFGMITCMMKHKVDC